MFRSFKMFPPPQVNKTVSITASPSDNTIMTSLPINVETGFTYDSTSKHNIDNRKRKHVM